MSVHFRWPHAAMAVCLLLSEGGLLTGCATKRSYLGHPSTDLSSLHAGAPRPDVDALLGSPAKEYDSEGIRKAWYLYDRGFVGTLENNSAGEKLFWAPIMAWGEMATVGLAGLMIHCQAPCQRGLLEVKYDRQGRLVFATEHVPADDHPAVEGCMTRPIRVDLAVCRSVRDRVRPSTLPRQEVLP